MTKPITQIRQGDVLLVRRPIPANPTRVVGTDGQPVAGLRVPGERSGHEHRLPARVYDDGDTRVLFLERPTPMRVVRADNPDVEFLMPDGRPRHPAVEVPAGWWQPIPQRQYVPASRPVSRARYD